MSEENKVETIDKSKEQIEKICTAFDLKIKSFLDSAAVQLNGHPRAVGITTQLHRNIMEFIRAYFVENKLPEIHVFTKEEMENSIGQPVTKKPPKRERFEEGPVNLTKKMASGFGGGHGKRVVDGDD